MLKPRDFNADRFPYDAMMPVFPLLAQQCLMIINWIRGFVWISVLVAVIWALKLPRLLI